MNQEFIDRCVAAAAGLALFFVGAPEDEMLLSLHDVRSNLEAGLSETFGPDVAAAVAQASHTSADDYRTALDYLSELPERAWESRSDFSAQNYRDQTLASIASNISLS